MSSASTGPNLKLRLWSCSSLVSIYCRFGKDSDAYVWCESEEIVCDISKKGGKSILKRFVFRSDAISFLRMYQSFGYVVPEDAIMRLKQEMKDEDNEVQANYSDIGGWDGVWMYPLKDRIVCKHCSIENVELVKGLKNIRHLQKRIEMVKKAINVKFSSRKDAIQHLRHHLELGHHVLENAISRLEREIKVLGDKVQIGGTPLKTKYVRGESHL